MGKHYIQRFFLPVFFVMLASSFAVAQKKAAAGKKPAAVKTKPALVAPAGKNQPRVVPARPAGNESNVPGVDAGSMMMENTINSAAPKEAVYKPRPNSASPSLIESVLAQQPGPQGELAKPFIVLMPEDPASRELFYRFYKTSLEYTKGPKTILIKDAEGKEDLAVVINGHQNLIMTMKAAPLENLNTYIFQGDGEILASTDPYIRKLDKTKYIYKMVRMRNVDFLPTSEDVLSTGGATAE